MVIPSSTEIGNHKFKTPLEVGTNTKRVLTLDILFATFTELQPSFGEIGASTRFQSDSKFMTPREVGQILEWESRSSNQMTNIMQNIEREWSSHRWRSRVDYTHKELPLKA
ncbi:hypothetical protein Ahy_B02g060983 isoform B [Arachis hypogaea]|uniref:Uncharacterized protein n=1 Tax=Arachis hypogaea TaxID=3818 RepID=A0A445AJR5_ARAHY|nr:hypothetical protein Ahy_B02g060983 isoform B [Arachis hypogaea]